MRYHFLIILACVIQSYYPQTSTAKDIIIWADTVKLTWKDYTKVEKSKVPPYEAGTTINIHFGVKIKNRKENIQAIARFSRSKSWVMKSSLHDEALLNHEKLHFDIAEIYARLCTKKIQSLKPNEIDLKLLQKLSNEYLAMAMKENLIYDDESLHGENKDKQKQWEERVKKRLTELSIYK
ncbi:MAG: hypothetical protein ACXVNM_13020 [Bacteroidia bacterium]